MTKEYTSFYQQFDLEGKIAVVTGGALGIGAGIVERFAEAHADVVIADINERNSHDLLYRLGYSPEDNKSHFISTDVTNSIAVDSMIEKVVARFGRLDILVSNAGIYPAKLVTEMSDQEWERVMGTNLHGTFFTNRAAARQMKEQGGYGRIINIGSVDSIRPWKVGLAAYDGSKAGLLGFSRNLALEMAPYEVTVNVIGPGDIDTPGSGGGNLTSEELKSDRVPLGRRGTPDDVAKLALFLASPAASYITGAYIPVDGGWLLTSSNN